MSSRSVFLAPFLSRWGTSYLKQTHGHRTHTHEEGEEEEGARVFQG
jgi:hypothetical protein